MCCILVVVVRVDHAPDLLKKRLVFSGFSLILRFLFIGGRLFVQEYPFFIGGVLSVRLFFVGA